MSADREKLWLENRKLCQEVVKYLPGISREDREDIASELLLYVQDGLTSKELLLRKAKWMVIDRWRKDHGEINQDPDELADGLGTLTESEWNNLMEMIAGDSTLIAIVEGLAMGQSTQEIAKTLGMNNDAARQKITRFKRKIKNFEKKS